MISTGSFAYNIIKHQDTLRSQIGFFSYLIIINHIDIKHNGRSQIPYIRIRRQGCREVRAFGHVPSIFLQRKAENAAYASGMEYNAMENAAGWCMRQLALGYGWETVSYEEQSLRSLSSAVSFRPTPSPEASVYPWHLLPSLDANSSQPRAFIRRLRLVERVEGQKVHKRADRFLPQPLLRKFRNFRPKKNRFIYLFTSREMSLIDVKLFHFSRYRDYRDACLRVANR